MSEPLRMVRNGVSLGLDMTPKFLWAICGLFASFQRFRQSQRFDYLFVYGIAGSYWFYLESQLLNARKASKHHPKLFKLIALSPFLTTVIRGFAEGGSFTLLGLMLGDKKYANKFVRYMLTLLFGTTFLASPYLHNTKVRKERISSVREIFKGNAWKQIAFWTVMMCIGMMRLRRKNASRLRRSFMALCVVGLAWNWFAYMMKCRWISRQKSGIYCGFIAVYFMLSEALCDGAKEEQDEEEDERELLVHEP